MLQCMFDAHLHCVANYIYDVLHYLGGIQLSFAFNVLLQLCIAATSLLLDTLSSVVLVVLLL